MIIIKKSPLGRIVGISQRHIICSVIGISYDVNLDMPMTLFQKLFKLECCVYLSFPTQFYVKICNYRI
jgi:Holliday junction resolvasome RuvABC DNA-binding subunit